MSTALVPFDAAKMAVALKQTAREGGSGAALFLKMEKSGAWVFGMDATEVDGESFYIHPAHFQHGYIAWDGDSTGNKLGEMMGSVTEEIPPTGPVPEGSEGWQFQLGMGLVMIEEALPMVYRATSVGGKRAIANIAGEISARLTRGDAACVPVVALESDSYMHKKYGKIYNPTFAIGGWATMAALEKVIAGASPRPAAPAAPAPAKKLPPPAAPMKKAPPKTLPKARR